MTNADRKLLRFIADRLQILPLLSKDAMSAAFCRQNGRTRGWYTTKEFAAVVGRNEDYITQRCRGGSIKTLPGGKPYRIPLSEETEWNLI
ncbi:hypothetical protein OpiT1DRAFT_05440 [Opitutaceae bacterium TAV1]|nr:hypothetical protein OpiT1DRAFT_05440 [Opitutaceae bacterium TAV1]